MGFSTAIFRKHPVRCWFTENAEPGRITGHIAFLDRDAASQDFVAAEPNAPEDEIHLMDGRRILCRVNTYKPLDGEFGFIAGRFA